MTRLTTEARERLADMRASASPHVTHLANCLDDLASDRTPTALENTIEAARRLASNADLLARSATDLAALRAALSIDDEAATQLRGSPFGAARDAGAAMAALTRTAKPEFASKLAGDILRLEADACRTAGELRDADARAHSLSLSLSEYKRDALASVNALTAQRDEAAAQATAYKAAWDRLARSLSGVTLGQLPADSYGADIAAAYLAGKRDLAESGL